MFRFFFCRSGSIAKIPGKRSKFLIGIHFKLFYERLTDNIIIACYLDIHSRLGNSNRLLNTIFAFRDQLIGDYASYVQSFLHIRDQAIQDYVRGQMDEGALWPEPLIQLNPLFEQGDSIDTLVAEGVLHPECARIFRKGKSEDDAQGQPLRLHRHQSEAVRVARSGASYVLTTGTGSGKSLSYILPIVDHVLRNGTGRVSRRLSVIQ